LVGDFIRDRDSIFVNRQVEQLFAWVFVHDQAGRVEVEFPSLRNYARIGMARHNLPNRILCRHQDEEEHKSGTLDDKRKTIDSRASW
jgi:hypothetical protein